MTRVLHRLYMLFACAPSSFYLYYSIKINLRSRKIAKSKKSRCEGCRPPRVANEGSMDRPFYGVDKVTKNPEKPDQPDEKFRFKIFKTLSWSQFLFNFDEILT